MNERIKQIAFEAGQGGHSWYNDPNCIQSFAELIVRECARVANDSNQSKNRAVGVSVGDVVREHFGVEAEGVSEWRAK